MAYKVCVLNTTLDSRLHLKLKCVNKEMTEVETHRLIDTFAEDGKHEDSCDGRREVAGDRLDVVKELTTLGCLHHRDPCYAHTNQGQDKHSKWRW